MPEEMVDEEKFIALSKRAKYCVVKRSEKMVKLKLRIPKRLVTLKTELHQAESIIKRLKCDTVES